MGFLAGAGAGAAGGAGASLAGATGAAGTGGAMTGLAGMGPELATASTPSFSGPPSTGGLLDWWNQQPQQARDAVIGGLGNLVNQRSPLPSPMTPQSMTPMSMPMPQMTGQPGQPADMSAMAPFLQALARQQGGNRFGASPFGFGVPGA
jgi:hypothetical protein